jgi:hypothetical protein
MPSHLFGWEGFLVFGIFRIGENSPFQETCRSKKANNDRKTINNALYRSKVIAYLSSICFLFRSYFVPI